MLTRFVISLMLSAAAQATPAPTITWVHPQNADAIPQEAVQTAPPDMQEVPDTKGSVLPPAESVGGGPVDRWVVASPPWILPAQAGCPDDYPITFYGVSQWGWGYGGAIPLTCDGWRLASWGSGSGVTSTGYAGTNQQPVSLSNMIIHGQPQAPGMQNMIRWGAIIFDINHWNWYRVTTEDIPQEHGVYGTINGGPLTWDECMFSECWGQAIQLVYAHPQNQARKHQTALPEARWYRLANMLQDEWITVRRTAILQSSIYTKSERASYPISTFEALNKDGPFLNRLLVEGCYMKTEWPWVDPNGTPRDSCGGIMAHGRKQVVIKRNYLEYKLGDRDVIQLWGCSDGQPGTVDVEISENAINASQNIDIRLRNANDTVVVRRNRGTCRVLISGPEQPWYAWPTSPTWRADQVIYNAPVSQDYRLN